jgi:predicted hotdog family 3-hydroxylacyl-ACP dehydratase
MLQVLVDWACAKISASSDVADAALRAQLDSKLRGRAGIRYAAIATHAQVLQHRSGHV